MNSDFLVVGVGMASASVGALLSDYGKVLILEGEERPGYHTTGRSAAFSRSIMVILRYVD